MKGGFSFIMDHNDLYFNILNDLSDILQVRKILDQLILCFSDINNFGRLDSRPHPCQGYHQGSSLLNK